MSWFARSIANSLKLDDDDDDGVITAGEPESKYDSPKHRDEDPSSPPSRGVKEDISELTKTLTRQFWGVASFLAPPPVPEQRSGSKNVDMDSAPGIRADFAEIGGKFRSAISQLSSNPNVSEITKMASNFLQLGSVDEEEGRRKEGFDGAVGVTEEVVIFVRDLVMHPETWLDFPIPDAHDVDFDLTDAQQEHALAVERLVPRLTALRIELCPGYMSESSFWKIYFVLLHPRLDEQDVELLSTPQIVKARTLLSQELKTRTAVKPENSRKECVYPNENFSSLHVEPLSVPTPDIYVNKNNKESDLEISISMIKAASGIVKHPTDINEIKVSGPEISTSMNRHASETVKHPVESKNIQILDKSGSVKDQSSTSGSGNISVTKDEDDADDWLKEENSEIGGAGETTIPIENEEDVSFSDLEEEDDVDIPATYRKSSSSSDKVSRDWVQIE